MPRIKRRNCVGQRRKHQGKSSFQKRGSTDHTYTLCEHQPQTDNHQSTTTSSDGLWIDAWRKFYMGDVSEGDDHCTNCNTEKTDSDNCSADEFFVVLHKAFQYSPEDDLDSLVRRITQDHIFELYHSLRKELANHVVFEGFHVLRNTEEAIQFAAFHNDGTLLTVKLHFILKSSLIPSLYVHRILVDSCHDFWTGLPKIVTSLSDLRRILDRLSSWDICVGNHEAMYVNTMPISTTAHDKTGYAVAYREGDFSAVRGDIKYNSTIRSTTCSLLTVESKIRCAKCNLYRHSLSKKIWRQDKNISPSFTSRKKTPHKYMSKSMMLEKMDVLSETTKSVRRELLMMRRKVFSMFGAEGQKLSDVDNEELIQLMKNYTNDFKREFPDESSPQRLFWEQQLKYSELSNKKQMRWHPMIVKWCLYIRSRSQKAYDAIRDAGFISLPSNRTLFDYSHCLPAKCGFDPAAIKHLKKEAENMGMYEEEWTTYVGILQDEVKISDGLVYDRVSGELVGYIDLDKTGNEMLNLENKMQNLKPKLATSMLVIMVRGITSSLKYPIACFATNGVTADILYPCIWKTIKYLERVCRLKVLFVTCDGASPNRKFFKLHVCDHHQNTYWTWNRFAPYKRKLYFISDVPHLLKTARNCFANSGSHNKSRHLWKDGQEISWGHIVRLYEEHVEPALYCHTNKLTRAHIDLTPFSKMKVNLAAQVLSKTVADSLEHLYGDSVSETVKFIRHMNKFFDCLNTRNLQEGIQKRNPNLMEYRDQEDTRLQYLTDEFLGYFESWEASVHQRQGPLSKSQRARMMLSSQTLQGFQISVRSITECVKFLLAEGAEFILTHRFNQDPLEEHFSHYRHKGGANSNPTVYDVRHNMSELRVIGSTALAPLRGNITNRKRQQLTVSNEPLMKRKK